MDNIRIENLQATPDEFHADNNPSDIEITWVQTLQNDNGNPVKYMLNLHPDADISFLTENNILTKRIAWEEDVPTGVVKRTKSARIVVHPKPDTFQSAVLRLDAEDARGFFDKLKFTLFYE